MNVKVAMVWVLAAGMWVAGVRGQEVICGISRLDFNPDGVTLYFDAVEDEDYSLQGTTSFNYGGGEWREINRLHSNTNGETAMLVPWEGSCFFRLIASMPEGEEWEVRNSNAVGYMKRTIPAGRKQMLTVPFVNLESDDGSFRFGETQMAKDLPVGSVVYFWDGERQTWDGGMKSVFGWDPAEANHVLQAGEGFGILNPSDEDIEVAVAGEVPSNPSLIRPFAGDSKWSVMANPYPVDVKFGDTELASWLPVGSEVLFWEPETQGWNGGRKGAKGWSAYSANQLLECGEAFFIKADYEGTWEAVKPYSWP